jgi:uncharacterized protein YdcH (DUF465 family)
MTTLIASMHQKLEQDFPNFADEARLLIRASLYFSKLVDDYLTACEQVDALMHEAQPTDEAQLHQVRKQRLELKDEIARRLSEARNHQALMFDDVENNLLAIAS